MRIRYRGVFIYFIQFITFNKEGGEEKEEGKEEGGEEKKNKEEEEETGF